MALPHTTKSRTWSTTTPNNGNYIDDEVDQLYENDNYLAGFIGENDLVHGLRNAKLTLSGTTLTLTTMSGAIGASNQVRIALPLAAGTLQWVSLSAALSMVLPSATFSERILQFTNADGSATLTLSGNAVNVCFFVYVVYDTDTAYLMISRSPFHTKMPANYYHTPSSSGMTRVGAAAPSTWDAAIISKSGTLTDANAPCVCIGPLVYGTVNGTNGRFSDMALTSGEFPKWNNRNNPYSLDGSALFRSFIRLTVSSGAGSTDTTCAKFTNATDNEGYQTQYLPAGGGAAASNVGGAELIVNEPGLYKFMFGGPCTNECQFAITRNSTQRATAISSVTLANKVSPHVFNGAAGRGIETSNTRRLSAGDILRLQFESDNTAGTTNFFEIEKVSW